MKSKLMTPVRIFLALVGILCLISLVVFCTSLQQEIKSKELAIGTPKVSLTSASPNEVVVDVTLKANLGQGVVRSEREESEQEQGEVPPESRTFDLKMTGRVCLEVEPFNLGIGPFSYKVGPLYFEVPFEKIKRISISDPWKEYGIEAEKWIEWAEDKMEVDRQTIDNLNAEVFSQATQIDNLNAIVTAITRQRDDYYDMAIDYYNEYVALVSKYNELISRR